MSTFRIRTGELSKRLKAEGEKQRRCVMTALKIASDKWLKYLRDEIDREDITVTGGYRDGFRKRTYAGKIVISNDHPASGVIEEGCGPHPVSEEGQALIEQWCIQKLGLSEQEAKRAVWPICQKIREFGQEPRWVVKRALPKMIALYNVELRRQLREARA